VRAVDASLVVRFEFAEPGGTATMELMDSWSMRATRSSSRSCCTYEFTNAALQRLKRAEFSAGEAEAAVAHLAILPLRVYDGPSLDVPALRIAAALGLPAAYDAQYVALAEELEAEFWTGDRQLYDAVREAHPRVSLV